MLGRNHLGNPSLQGDEDMAKRISFGVDGRTRTVIADDPDMPLLYALRNDLGVTGPKFGCGLAQCGACLRGQEGSRWMVTGQGAFSTRTTPLPSQTFSNAPSPHEKSVTTMYATD